MPARPGALTCGGHADVPWIADPWTVVTNTESGTPGRSLWEVLIDRLDPVDRAALCAAVRDLGRAR